LTALALVLMLGATASAADFFFTTGDPDGRLAAAARPESRHKIEIEAADDFILTSPTTIDEATFTGLLFHESTRTYSAWKSSVTGCSVHAYDP
jgi:hypothetical protein